MARPLWLLLMWLLWLAVSCAARAAEDEGADDIEAAVEKLNAQFASQVQELLAWCRERGLEDEAAYTTSWAAPPHPRLLRIELPPQRAGGLEAGLAEGPPDAEWRRRFVELRRARAAAAFPLVARAAKAARYSLAVSLFNETLRCDPDHAAARALLGEELHESPQGGRWLTPFAAGQEKKGRVWHERFGWLPREQVERYEAGMRFDRGKWITAEEDARRHGAVSSPWRVLTEHYAVATNHSLEQGVRLSARLETLRRVWSVLFPTYVARGEPQLMKMFSQGPLVGAGGRPHAVTYFKDREDFQQGVAGKLPTNLETTGLYLPSARTSYFYHDESSDESTLVHEATHQLFSELGGKKARTPGQREGFWAIEGIACYFESLRIHDGGAAKGGHATLGGVDAYRVQDARFYLFRNGFFIPAAEFVQLGTSGWQRPGEGRQIRMMYAQAAALCDFLMHAEGGRRRDGLAAYLAAVYAGKELDATPWMGPEPETFDDRFRDYLRIGDDDLAARSLGNEASYFTLGGSRVTDAGLAQLTGLDRIGWLDVSGTAVSDAGLAQVARLKTLRKLDLSGAKITDDGLRTLAELSNLESLDLSGTPVTEEGVSRLRQALPRLEIKR
jgi:hypothetical protein